MKSFQANKIVVALALLASSAGLSWASCGGTESLVVASVVQMGASVIANISSVTSAIIKLDMSQSEMLVSSIRATTKQVEASGEKAAATIIQAEQSNAALNKELADKELVDKVVVDYLSQGFNPCEVSDLTSRVARAELEAKAALPARYRTEIAAVGGKYADPAAVVRYREELHRSNFCTQSEADAGVCSLGKIPGGDINAALLFGTDASADAQAAKNALINNLVGLPDAPIPPSAANSPEAQSYLMAKKRKDSYLAWSAYSLKSIQSDNEKVMPVLNERIGMYFGTAKAAEWAQSQASQAPRGLLVDMVKIAGLDLKVSERRLWQNLRTEANLASLVDLENQAKNGAALERFSGVVAAETGRRAVQ